MSLRLSHTTVSAVDAHAQAEFWRGLLRWEKQNDYGPGDEECYLVSPHGYTVLFYKVEDPKPAGWNRLHFDLVPDEGSSRDAEVERAVGLGASIKDDRREEDGWVVLIDPEGNEFCILNEG